MRRDGQTDQANSRFSQNVISVFQLLVRAENNRRKKFFNKFNHEHFSNYTFLSRFSFYLAINTLHLLTKFRTRNVAKDLGLLGCDAVSLDK